VRKFLLINASNTLQGEQIMNCDQINKNLIGYIEQAIPVDLQKKISAHLQECKTCRALYENVVATYTVYDKIPVTEVNPFFYTRLEQKLKAKHLTNETFVPKMIWKLQPIAASFLIVVGIGLGIMIGKSISGSSISLTSPNRSEILEAYASDYYLTSSGDESLNVLMNNE